MKFKNVSFDKDKIVFHKKDGSITLIKSNIEDIEYVKPTLFNYLLSGIAPGSLNLSGKTAN